MGRVQLPQNCKAATMREFNYQYSKSRDTSGTHLIDCGG